MVMKNGVFRNNNFTEKGSTLLASSTLVLVLALVTIVSLGLLLEAISTNNTGFVIGGAILLFVLVLRQHELVVTMVIATHIYIDWYLGLAIVAPTIIIGILFILFIFRSQQNSWIAPRYLWLWGLFLLLTIYPAIQGDQVRYDLAFYWPNLVFAPLLMFWMGTLLAKDRKHLRTLFQLLALLGTLLAIHTIIQTVTGVVIFSSPHGDANLAQALNYQLGSTGVSRSGSFFQNPDWNGTFFALVLFLPLGLLTEASSFLLKMLYLAEMVLMTVALLFTYSIGAWFGAVAGIFIFVLFAGQGYMRILVPLVVAFLGALLVVIFPTQVNLMMQHLSNPSELLLRTGAWQTALNIIRAYPLTGIGMGFTNYLQRAEAYRVPAEYVALAHPHNSYLEWGAMAGLPVLLLFLALLCVALRYAWRNWRQTDAGTRCLVGGGIAAIVALSANSLSINGWTLPPLAAIGWLVLGAVASPLLIRTGVGTESTQRQEKLE